MRDKARFDGSTCYIAKLWLGLAIVLGSLWSLHARADLPAPSMQPAPVNNELDPAQIPSSGVLVTTMTGGPTYNQQPLTLILRQVNGPEVHRVQTTVGLSTRPIRLSIPKQAFDDNSGVPLQLRYEVGTQVVSEWLSFAVAAGFAAAHSIDLANKPVIAIYRDGQRLLPGPGPALDLLTYSREAPGASAYTSSNTDIATVDSRGKVTLLSNGQTTITAQTPRGPQAYVLTLTGLRSFEIVSKTGTTWALAQKTCQELGGRLPGAVDFEDVKEIYPGGIRQLELPDYSIWGSNTGLGAGTALTLHPRTERVEGHSTDANTLFQVACIRG